MSSRVLALIALPCFLIAGTTARSQTSPSTAEPRLAQALKEIDSLLKQWGPETGPGCIYAAAKDGRTLFIRAYGRADLEQDVPVAAGSVFNAASIAKQFTAAAILLLVQDGKLRLDDDIRKYLPEMPDYGTPITIRHLLNHTSGLREWSAVEELSGRPPHWRFYDNADVLKIASRQRSLNHAPGERWSYTNTGYILLAIIARRVSGSSLAEITRDRLFKPLGMDSTQWTDDLRRVVKRRATGYYKAATKTGGTVYVKTVLVIGNTYGSGGLLTTASDLLTWNEALDSGRLGSFVTTELQRKAVLNGGRSIDYGGGLDIRRYNGQDWFEHGGSIPGFKSTLERFPQSRLSIAVLCNNDDAQPRLISGKIAEALVPAESQPETAKTGAALTLTPEQLAARTGLFIIEQTGFPVVITADKGRLVVDKEPPMETISENRFRSPGPWGELVFKTPDLAERVVKTQPDGLQTLRRIDATIPAEAQLSEFTGRYNSDEAEGSYSIVLEKGALVMTGSDLQGREIGRPIPISPVARDLFQMPGVMIRFNRGPDGKVNSFDLTTERVRALRFHRTPVAAPAVSSKEALIIIIGIGKSSLICHPEQKVKSPTVSSNFSGFSMRAENWRF